MDEVWYIYVSEDVRRIRLSASRGYSDEKISNIFKSQLSEAEFRKYADKVIDNGSDIEKHAPSLRLCLEYDTFINDLYILQIDLYMVK